MIFKIECIENPVCSGCGKQMCHMNTGITEKSVFINYYCKKCAKAETIIKERKCRL